MADFGSRPEQPGQLPKDLPHAGLPPLHSFYGSRLNIPHGAGYAGGRCRGGSRHRYPARQALQNWCSLGARAPFGGVQVCPPADFAEQAERKRQPPSTREPHGCRCTIQARSEVHHAQWASAPQQGSTEQRPRGLALVHLLQRLAPGGDQTGGGQSAIFPLFADDAGNLSWNAPVGAVRNVRRRYKTNCSWRHTHELNAICPSSRFYALHEHVAWQNRMSQRGHLKTFHSYMYKRWGRAMAATGSVAA